MKKDNFYDDLKALFEEHASINFNGVQSKDNIYQKLKNVLHEKTDDFHNMIEELKLDEANKKIADDLISAMYDCQFYENFYQYLKGYKDCFKMIAYIGIFKDFNDLYEMNDY